MSRIGKIPIAVPDGVKVAIEKDTIRLSGAKGELVLTLPPRTSVAHQGTRIDVKRDGDDKIAKAMHGTARSLISNMVEGVSKGFSRTLEIQGVGFRAQVQGQNLVLTLGYSHPIEYKVPEGIQIQVDGVNVVVSGADKQAVGQTSAQLRSFCPAEPYKGKGIRYKDEQVRRKVGKTVA